MGRYASVQKVKLGDVDVRIVPALPTNGEAGELVYLSSTSGKGLYIHNGVGWEIVGNSGGSGGSSSTTADRLSNPRRISISGDATGYGMFDGSSDVDIAIDVPLATINIPGLMTANDKVALTTLVAPDGTLRVPLLSDDLGTPLKQNAESGISTEASRSDHVHPLPPLATAVADGLLSKEDKQKLDGISTGGGNINLSDNMPEDLSLNPSAGLSNLASRSDHTHALPNLASITNDGLLSKEDKDKINKMKEFTELLGTIIPKKSVDSLGSVGVGDRFAREDHIHPLPELVTITANGLMSSADKVKLDGISSTPMIPVSQKGVALGVATLLADGKIDPLQLPSLSTSNVFVFNNQADMIATNYSGGTNPVIGDVVVRTDETKSYILKATPHTNISNWQQLLSPTSPIQSVNGYTNANITLNKSDIQLSNVDNTSDLSKPISTATQSALDTKQDKLGYIPVNKAGDTADKLILKAPIVEQSNTINISTANTTYTVDYNAGSVAKLNCTLSSGTFNVNISNMVSGKVSTIILLCVNFGGKQVAWPTGIKWVGGTAPALSTTGTDIVMILKDSSDVFYGFISGKDFK